LFPIYFQKNSSIKKTFGNIELITNNERKLKVSVSMRKEIQNTKGKQNEEIKKYY
jgi:hypothetical protein